MPTSLNDFAELSDSQKILLMNIALTDTMSKANKHEALLVTGTEKDLPIVERLRNLEGFINSIKYWVRLLVGAILLQTIAFGSAAIIYFVKLYPILEKLADQP